MITAGIDCGAKTVKVLILKDGRVIGKSLALAGFDTKAATEQSFNIALREAGLSKNDIQRIVATGAGRLEAAFLAKEETTEVAADARGAIKLFPSARTVIDVGAEEGRAIKIDRNGKVVDFAVNEKCAAGAGAFMEAMSRALEVPLEELGELTLKSQRAVPMNAQCVVFAESEVVTLIHAKTPKEDISRAIHDAISDRIVSMVRRIGLERDVVLIGGVAKNIGFVNSLNRDLELEVKIPEEPEFVGALGAAILAAE